MLHPVALDLGSEPIVGAAALFHTFKRWIAECGGDGTGVGSAAALPAPRDQSGAAIISGESSDA